MTTNWTVDQILQLSPDASSTRSGQELANPRKWVMLGSNEQAVWGACQGSGKTPYQAQIDLSGPAFTCTCPSRKFPCKHGLGLFLLSVKSPASFKRNDPPMWVKDWLEARARRSEQKVKKDEKKQQGPDLAAQAKRIAERQAKITAGLEELERWLEDLIRQGLATAQGRPYKYWDGPAARLVDAQAPGLARQLREMASIPASGAGWQEKLLDRLSRLYLLLEGYKRLESLPAPVQADIRSVTGWNWNQDEILLQPGVADQWLVVGRRQREDDRLKTLRTWLLGRNSGQSALVLSFAYGNDKLDLSLLPGTSFEGELAFFPGNYPQRALVKSRGETTLMRDLPGLASFNNLAGNYTAALARNPWLVETGAALTGVIPVNSGDSWYLRDGEGNLLRLSKKFNQEWELLAISGGYPVDLFGEWNGEFFLPLSAFSAGRLVIFEVADDGEVE